MHMQVILRGCLTTSNCDIIYTFLRFPLPQAKLTSDKCGYHFQDPNSHIDISNPGFLNVRA